MTGIKQRPAGKVGRNDDAKHVRAGQAKHTTADKTSVHRLPAAMRARYLRDCEAWEAIYADHRANMHLLDEAWL